MAIPKTTLRLTAQGRAKLQRIKRVVRLVARQSLEGAFNTMAKPQIHARAPTEAEEGDILSRGTAPNIGIVGDSGGGRFGKLGGQKTVKEAIAEDIPRVREIGGVVILTFGHTEVINPQIGFSWITSKGQIKETSVKENAWANLIQFWEEGGTFVITPRGAYPLKPEDSVVVGDKDGVGAIMVKTIPAFKMYASGYATVRGGMRSFVKKAIKNAARRVR